MRNTFSALWLKLRTRPLIWDTFTTSGWNAVGRGVGFLIPFFVAAWFGVTAETDAFFYAYGVILIFTGILYSVVGSVIIPYIAEAKANNEDVGKFVGGILEISGVGLLFLSLLVILLSKPVLSIVTRFDGDNINLLFYLLIEMSPLIILLVWTSILSGALNAYKKFAFPAVSPAIRAVINLLLIWIFKDSLGIHAITLGYVGGEIVRLIALLSIIRYFNLFKISFSLNFEPKLIQFLITASYPVIGMIAIEFGSIFNKTIATWLGEGSVSLLHYAEKLYMIPVVLFAGGLLITLHSYWSEHYYKLDRNELKTKMKRTIKIVALLSLLLTLFLIFLHKPIVKLAFGRGEFDQTKLSKVGNIWICYLLGFVPYSISRIFIRVQIIRKNTKVIMFNVIYGTIVNILFCLILMRYLKVEGIALASTIALYFEVIYMGIHFYKYEKEKSDA